MCVGACELVCVYVCAWLICCSGHRVAWYTPDLGATLLHYAARANHLDLIRFCLAHGARASALTEAGETPLHWLFLHGHSTQLNNAHRPNRASCSPFVTLSHKCSKALLASAVTLIRAGGSLFAPCAAKVRPWDQIASSVRHRFLLHATLRDRCLAALDALPPVRRAAVCAVRLKGDDSLRALHLLPPLRPHWYRARASELDAEGRLRLRVLSDP